MTHPRRHRLYAILYGTVLYGTVLYGTVLYQEKVSQAISCVPYLTLPYLALPCLALPYLTLPYLTLPYLVSSLDENRGGPLWRQINKYYTNIILMCALEPNIDTVCCRPRRSSFINDSSIYSRSKTCYYNRSSMFVPSVSVFQFQTTLPLTYKYSGGINSWREEYRF